MHQYQLFRHMHHVPAAGTWLRHKYKYIHQLLRHMYMHTLHYTCTMYLIESDSNVHDLWFWPNDHASSIVVRGLLPWTQL